MALELLLCGSPTCRIDVLRLSRTWVRGRGWRSISSHCGDSGRAVTARGGEALSLSLRFSARRGTKCPAV